ncbi:MAG: hypothetical protein GEV11_17040 [Streptosporangiales bacterium]|nr:hypothetical protein [Streptosporangiales bacterium]
MTWSRCRTRARTGSPRASSASSATPPRRRSWWTGESSCRRPGWSWDAWILEAVLNEHFIAVLRRHLSHLGPDRPPAPEEPLSALGLDSLRAVTLILDLEDEFGVTLSDDSLAGLDTPAALWAAIQTARAPT